MPDALLHRVEVPHHQRDVAQDAADALLELGVHLVAQGAIDLEVHEGLAVLGLTPRPHLDEPALFVPDRSDHRVQEPLDREAARGELLGDRVDQERRVVGRDLDHRAVASVPVDVGIGVEDPHGGGFEAPAVGEGERGGGERVQLVGRDRLEVVFGEAAEQRAREGADGLGPLPCGVGPRPRLGAGLTRDPSEHLLDPGVKLGGGGGAR